MKLLNDTSNCLELINNWFDLANVAHSNDKTTPFKSLYKTFLFEKDKLLDKIYDAIISMRCKETNCLHFFSKIHSRVN